MPAKLCIITICFENPEDLDRTCRSVAQSINDAIEHLIVDGSRDDRCAKVAQRYPQARYIGGRDRGKYDAMNKGVAVTQALSVLFINSGDQLADPIQFAELVSEPSLPFGEKMIFGDCIKRVRSEYFYEKAPDISAERLRVGLLPSHQSIIIPRLYQAAHPYDIDLHFAADTKFLKAAFLTLEYLRLDIAIGLFEYGGISASAGSVSSIMRQYRELKDVHELVTWEKIATAYLLIRRKLVSELLGEQAVLRAHARRLSRTCTRRIVDESSQSP